MGIGDWGLGIWEFGLGGKHKNHTTKTQKKKFFFYNIILLKYIIYFI